MGRLTKIAILGVAGWAWIPMPSVHAQFTLADYPIPCEKEPPPVAVPLTIPQSDELTDRSGLKDNLTASDQLFAGDYRIVSWSCGAPCEMHYIQHIDTKHVVATFSSSYGIEYHSTSCLIEVNVQSGDPGHGIDDGIPISSWLFMFRDRVHKLVRQ